MAFQSSSVSIGASTKKSDYDRLMNNTQYNKTGVTRLESGTVSFQGTKTFQSGTVFNATATFNIGATVPVLHVQDQKTSGTVGGTFNDEAWITRDLNTELTNTITGASLSSNQITLPAGIYKIYARAPAYRVDQHKAKLRNITDSSDELIGSNSIAQDTSNDMTDSIIIGLFTIDAEKVFELQHFCKIDGTFGLPITISGIVEIYADVFIEKTG